MKLYQDWEVDDEGGWVGSDWYDSFGNTVQSENVVVEITDWDKFYNPIEGVIRDDNGKD